MWWCVASLIVFGVNDFFTSAVDQLPADIRQVLQRQLGKMQVWNMFSKEIEHLFPQDSDDDMKDRVNDNLGIDGTRGDSDVTGDDQVMQDDDQFLE